MAASVAILLAGCGVREYPHAQTMVDSSNDFGRANPIIAPPSISGAQANMPIAGTGAVVAPPMPITAAAGTGPTAATTPTAGAWAPAATGPAAGTLAPATIPMAGRGVIP